MPHGRGHNKGFEYYMCKKFFHPNAPHNQELKWKAEMKQAAKEKLEQERSDEYRREQERWKTKHLLSSEEARLKMELSFMYEPPPGVQKNPKNPKEVIIDEKTGKEKGEGWSDSICYKCDKVGHFARECPNGIKFDWQRNAAPRESFARDDPNIIDKPFGIMVNKVRCMKCEVWGHSHTEKICPKYGKAKDSEEPILQVDPDVLIQKMRKDGLKLNRTNIWDNGKTKKQYDLVYSDDEEQEDLLVNLVSKMRNKNLDDKVKNRRKRGHSSKDDDENNRAKKRRKSRKKSKCVPSSKKDILSKVDKILDLKESAKSKKYSEEKMMKKVDKILFSDISSSVSQKDKTEARNKFLDEVDEVLGLGSSSSSKDDDDDDDVESPNDSDSERDVSDSSDEEEDDLNEDEMRLLNLINIKKIDVKVNFQSVYPDTDCHFCRKKETNQHLAKCPVYDSIMTGTEFKDIKSEDVRVVKTALANIKSALLKRAEALSVTSLGEISSANMKLLLLNENVKRKKTKEELIDEILATT